MKKLFALLLCVSLFLSMGTFASAESQTYKIGICNLVDDASLNQIVENIEAQLKAAAEEKGVTFDISYENCNMDFGALNQIIADFIAKDVNLMIGIATPVALAMQGATEENQIPVVFAAVSDPLSNGLVASLEAPGANITGSSDYLDTAAVFNLIFAANPELDTVGLLYDLGQDASATPIADAKKILDEKGIAYKEYTGTTTQEIQQAAANLASDGVKVAFTPQDNTVMAAELSIYESLAAAGVQQYTGADSFALNGAFLGYGVDYANLGRETGALAAKILLEGAEPASTPVLTFDNGTATVNTETAEALGLNYDELAELFAPYCIKVQPITTAESFSDLD